MIQLTKQLISKTKIRETTTEILDEFAVILSEFAITFPDGSKITKNSKNSLGNEAYDLLMESIQEKLKNLIERR